jgi:hypothetical protein
MRSSTISPMVCATMLRFCSCSGPVVETNGKLGTDHLTSWRAIRSRSPGCPPPSASYLALIDSYVTRG